MKRLVFLLLAFMLITVWMSCFNSVVYALDATPPTQLPDPDAGINAPALKYVAPGVFEIGRCRIIKSEGKVEFPASVNMSEGLLEYAMVGSAGKLHESLLRTEVEPYALQVALLLTGLEGSLNPLHEQGENRTPQGDAVRIEVIWQKKGVEKKNKIEDWVLSGKKKITFIPWVFTGSIVYDRIFAAQMEKSMIALFHDPVALIDHQLEQGNSDESWFVNSAEVPPIGTSVKVVVTKISK